MPRGSATRSHWLTKMSIIRKTRPARLRQGFQRLKVDLSAEGIEDFAVYPCAEVMVRPDIDQAWDRGELLSVSDGGLYVLLEMPHGLCVELAWLIERLITRGVRPILAQRGAVAGITPRPGSSRTIDSGGLPDSDFEHGDHKRLCADTRALKDWVRRGVAHVLGSDGHSPRRRPPDLFDAYERLRRWAGASTADSIASANGLAVLRNRPLRLPPVAPPVRRWLPRLW